ncbi:MAG: hypothetical protein L3K13_00965 [Thermoplasmata archaeon]|nr:hypothetical protein [Thermoplasmata archaeon]
MLRPAVVRRALPALAVAVLLTALIAASLAPDTGAVPAQSTCQYGNCSSPSNSTPLWAWGAVGGFILLIAALIALLLIRNRRRGGGAASASAVPPDAGVAATEGPVTPGGGAAAVAVPAYMETEDDVGAAPTVMPSTTAAADVPEPAPGSEEPNIDSLMDELDRISGEILKKDPKVKGSAPPSGDASEPGNESG